MLEIAAPAVELRDIEKRFGPVHANRAVNLCVATGSIHGIVGENGAGKSTLMNILYGLYQADRGDIRIAGQAIRLRSPAEAIAAGIGMVHQHFMLVEPLTVLENIVLGVEQGWGLGRSLQAAREAVEAVQATYGLTVDLDACAGDLPVGLQQRVEILKALYRGARVLILDEPTGVLTPQEAEELFRILRELRDRGQAVILITHKLREILAVTDRVSVMRQGAIVAERATAETDEGELAELMVGRKVALQVEKATAAPGEVVLSVDHLVVEDARGVRRVDDVSFNVRRGEIVGIAGVSGNGQTELLEAIAGIRPAKSGQIMVDGAEVRSGERPSGLGHVPEDRLRMGLVRDLPAWENALLGYHQDPAYGRGKVIDRRALRAACEAWMDGYDVRPRRPELRARSFSGGNQQKLVVAREIEHDPALLLVGQPTRGVDIGAIEFIHRQFVELREAGKGILLVSVELEEVLALADRILVLCEGRITGERLASEADERTLGLMMAGIEVA